MSGIWDSFVEGSRKIGETLGLDGIAGESRSTRRKRSAAIEAARPRKPPALDEMELRQQQADALSRRRGVLANIYGGARQEQPSTAVKQLLG